MFIYTEFNNSEYITYTHINKSRYFNKSIVLYEVRETIN